MGLPVVEGVTALAYGGEFGLKGVGVSYGSCRVAAQLGALNELASALRGQPGKDTLAGCRGVYRQRAAHAGGHVHKWPGGDLVHDGELPVVEHGEVSRGLIFLRKLSERRGEGAGELVPLADERAVEQKTGAEAVFPRFRVLHEQPPILERGHDAGHGGLGEPQLSRELRDAALLPLDKAA